MSKVQKKDDKDLKVSYRTLRAISYKGERVEKGSVLNLSSKDLENINVDYIELVNKKKELKKQEEEKKVEEEKKEGSEIEI